MSTLYEPTYRYTEADFDGTNAAPLLLIGDDRDEAVVARQDKLISNFVGAVHERLNGRVAPEVVSFTSDSVKNRIQVRGSLNSRAFMLRAHQLPQLALVPDVTIEQLNEAADRSISGQASLAQHALAATAWEMTSWEGKNITLIQNFRKHLEPRMWDEASEFTGVDARPKFETMRGFKVHQFVGGDNYPEPIKAMRIEMKRTIAQLDDRYVLKARTFAVVNTNAASGFQQRDIRSIYEAWREGEDMANHHPLLTIIERLVDDELPEGVVLARNETVYGLDVQAHALAKAEEANKLRAAANTANQPIVKEFIEQSLMSR